MELQTEEMGDLKNTGVLPLRIVLNAGGPVQVMSQNKGKIQKQEQYVKNGIQDGLAFELCIRAFDDGYDVSCARFSIDLSATLYANFPVILTKRCRLD